MNENTKKELWEDAQMQNSHPARADIETVLLPKSSLNQLTVGDLPHLLI